MSAKPAQTQRHTFTTTSRVTALEDVHASADALEDAHAAADLEEEAIIPDAAAHPGGRPKRARRQNPFFGDGSSSDSSRAAAAIAI